MTNLIWPSKAKAVRTEQGGHKRAMKDLGEVGLYCTFKTTKANLSAKESIILGTISFVHYPAFKSNNMSYQ